MSIWDFLKKLELAPSSSVPLDCANFVAGKKLLLEYVAEATLRRDWWNIKPQEGAAGQAILTADPQTQIAVIMAALVPVYQPGLQTRHAARQMVSQLFRRRLPYTEANLAGMCRLAAGQTEGRAKQSVIRAVQPFVAGNGMGTDLRAGLEALRDSFSSLHPQDAEGHKIKLALDALLDDEPPSALKTGEPWGEGALADLARLPPPLRSAWNALLAHASESEATKPSQKWLAKAKPLVHAVGEEAFQVQVLAWFSRFAQVGPATSAIISVTYEDYTEWQRLSALCNHNYGVLKGLVWCCRLRDNEAMVNALGDLAQASLKKIPQHGPKSAKVGNACIVTLAAMPGLAPIAQISRLKQRVQYQASLGLIAAALTEASARAGLPPEELEELAAPSFGLNSEGRLREEFGEYAVTLAILADGREEITWTDKDGKPLKSVPATVKREHADALKQWKTTADDIRKSLSAQRDRLERLLLRDRSWLLPVWRARYLEHPLVSTLARRLIWHFRDGEQSGLGVWQEGEIVDETGAPLPWLSDQTQVRLWHPLGFPPETVLAWRRFLEEQSIVQPFKQAHREIYILTDAEIGTGTYSNRFAAHILKQHQMAALCRQRGWQFHLQGGFDSHNVPTKTLAEFGLRVEFWVDPVAEESLSASYIYLYLSTDQVRFYNQSGDLLPLTEVPALAFSEALREVDLFVGVCSVGNDPAWRDGGVPDLHRNYWHDYSFGNLNASAQTRKDVLSRLLPRLKIASQCALDGKYLSVRGHLRTYKIHLGSGNILMEPNDQYLCIVPDRSQGDKDSLRGVFLPFEGDSTLSVILSKAFLLADDTRIKDPTIVRQIKPS